MFKRISIITDEFIEFVNNQVSRIIYRTPSFKGGKKWLSIIETKTSDREDNIFYHVQRLGKDSVAFCLLDKNNPTGLVILKSWSSPYRKFTFGAFTGSLDKPELSIEEVLLEEVKEESGYDVGLGNVIKVSEDEVGTSTDEVCHLYVIDITGVEREDKEPENLFEKNSNLVFMKYSDIHNLRDWRAKLISTYVEKYIMSNLI